MTKDSIDVIVDQWQRELPEHEVWTSGLAGRLVQLGAQVRKTTEELFLPLDLSWETFEIIAALRRSGAPYCLNATALHGMVLVTTGAITNRIDKAEVAGLLARSRTDKDRRAVLVTLTPKGIALAEKAMTMYFAHYAKLFDYLDKKSRNQLANSLRTIAQKLDEVA